MAFGAYVEKIAVMDRNGQYRPAILLFCLTEKEGAFIRTRHAGLMRASRQKSY
jgi:hypothetical protein